MAAKSTLKDYLLCVAAMPPLNAQEMADCERRLVEKHERQARRLLEERFLAEVLRWVAPYRGFGVGFEDLIALGNRAMMLALRRYTPEEGLSLRDYLEDQVTATVETAILARH